MNHGFVYLMYAETGHHKIGLSKKPTDRLKVFTTEMPLDVRFVHVFPVDDMRAAEIALHRQFQEKRFRGEWFSLDVDDVKSICEITSYDCEIGFRRLDPPTDDDTRQLMRLAYRHALISKGLNPNETVIDEDDLCIAFTEHLTSSAGISHPEALSIFHNSMATLECQGTLECRRYVTFPEWYHE